MKPLSFLNTFDFELYLGADSGTAENCVLKPTAALLKVLQKHQLTSIFFIDATYLSRLKEIASKHAAARKDYDAICAQLNLIKKEGHKIYLHLHPHWLDARYDEKTNRWNLSDKSRFSFNRLTAAQREEVFQGAYKTLAEIVNDSIKGFRAGGLFVQPFSDFHFLFRKNGIVYEFSVLRGAYSNEAEGFSFDFGSYPARFAYRFEEDVLKENSNGAFVEFTVNALQIPFAWRLLNRVANRLSVSSAQSARYGDGLPSGNKIHFHSQSKNSVWETFAVENISAVKQQLYFKAASEHRFLHLLSHPKLISPNTLNVYDGFLQKLKLNFDIVTDLNSILKQT